MSGSVGRGEVPAGKLWSIILAGGEGERIRPFIQQWLGRHRPKQYCTFVGTRSLLQHTLDRADRLTAPERRVTVIARGHQPEMGAQFRGRNQGKVVLQPANRDTAAGVFLPLTYVRAYDHEGLVIIYPSDHFVHPEDKFLQAVSRAASAAARVGDRLVLLGVVPDGPEPEYGWIQPGREIGWSPGACVRDVTSFLEKPVLAAAQTAMTSGALWNTLVMATHVETLWELGREHLPEIVERFERLGSAIGTRNEEAVLEEIYRDMPRRNFSAHLLQRAPHRVAVMGLRGVLWSDWGRPERIVETLERIGRKPAFPAQCVMPSWQPRVEPRAPLPEGALMEVTK